MTNARRVQQIRSRARVRSWEFRQRHLAHGAWHRFRLALAAAQAAYAIDDGQYAALVAEGFTTDDRGNGLAPPTKLVWITAQRAREIGLAVRIDLRLDANLFGSRALALVPFP